MTDQMGLWDERSPRPLLEMVREMGIEVDDPAALDDVADRLIVRLVEELCDEEVEQVTAQPGVRRHSRMRGSIGFGARRLEVRVPRIAWRDGTTSLPERYRRFSARERQNEEVARLAGAGVTSRKYREALVAAGEQAPRGMGKTAFQTRNRKQADADLTKLRTRDLQASGAIVAIDLDGLAVGSKGKKRTVVVAIGTTTTGARVALDIATDQYETAELVTGLLRRIAERGVDPTRVAWRIDGGKGLSGGIRAVAGASAPVQRDVEHKRRNLRDALVDAANFEQVNGQLSHAWATTDPARALEALEACATTLDSLGEEKAARSLRGDVEQTVTFARLGVSGTLLRAMRHTQGIESVMGGVRRRTRRITTWNGDAMREAWVAWALMREEAGWTPIPCADELAVLPAAVAAERARVERAAAAAEQGAEVGAGEAAAAQGAGEAAAEQGAGEEASGTGA